MRHSKSRSLTYALLTLAALLPPIAPAAAQQEELFWLHREAVKPDRIAEYEATARELIAFVQANRDVMPKFNFQTWMSTDLSYVFVTPIGNSLAGSDFFPVEFAGAMGKKPAEFTKLMHLGGEQSILFEDTILAMNPAHSYEPAMPRLKPEERNFAHFDFYHIIPGHEDVADQIAKDYVALYKKKNIADGYYLLRAIFGPEVPVYIVRTDAKDPADYWQKRMETEKLLGPEGQELAKRAMAITRRLEVHDAFRRPDLSLMPPAPAAAAKK